MDTVRLAPCQLNGIMDTALELLYAYARNNSGHSSVDDSHMKQPVCVADSQIWRVFSYFQLFSLREPPKLTELTNSMIF